MSFPRANSPAGGYPIVSSLQECKSVFTISSLAPFAFLFTFSLCFLPTTSLIFLLLSFVLHSQQNARSHTAYSEEEVRPRRSPQKCEKSCQDSRVEARSKTTRDTAWTLKELHPTKTNTLLRRTRGKARVGAKTQGATGTAQGALRSILRGRGVMLKRGQCSFGCNTLRGVALAACFCKHARRYR